MSQPLGYMGDSVTEARVADEKSLLDIELSRFVWAIAVVMLMFQPALQDWVPQFSWLDELVTLALCVAAVLRKVKHRLALNSREWGVALLVVVFCLVTFVGNLRSGVPESSYPVLIDSFTCVKFFAVTLAGIFVFIDEKDLIGLLVTVSKALLAVLSVCALVSLVLDVGMSTSDVRFGLRPFCFVFPHPNYLALAVVGIMIILSSDIKKNLPWLVVAAAVLALTLRGKAIGFAVFALFVILMTGSGKRRITLPQVLAVSVVVAVIGWGQIEAYFGTEGQARFELMRGGIEVARDFFPTGSGFATFGSAITSDSQWYSSLYDYYDLSSVWGLSREYSAFISDSYWPTVLGQSGWLGLLVICGELVLLYRATTLMAKVKLPVLLCAAYLLIMSTSESAFFNPSAVYLSICAVLASRQRPPACRGVADEASGLESPDVTPGARSNG